MTRITHYYMFVIVLALGIGYNLNSIGAASPPPDIDANSTLEDYLTIAAMNNPNLKAAYNDWKAAVERVPQAKSLDDPILAYEHYVVRMQERWNIGISQAIPWFGKLKLREDIAAKKALALYYKYLSKHLELNFNISKAYHDYHYLGSAIQTTQENIELLKKIEQTALTRYRSSQTTQSDLLRIQVELLKLEDKLRNLNGLTEPYSARLNSLLNRHQGSKIPIPTEIKLSDIQLSEKEITGLAILNNPDIQSLEANIEASEADISLAKKAYYPDFRFGIGYMDMKSSSMGGGDDDNPVMIGVMLNIPIWRDKYSAKVREARSNFFAISNRKNDKSNNISSQISMAFYDYSDAERKIKLYADSLIPMAQQSVNLQETEFSTGNGDFINFIDAQRLLLELKLSHQRAISDKEIAASNLNMLTGGAISNIQLPTINEQEDTEND